MAYRRKAQLTKKERELLDSVARPPFTAEEEARFTRLQKHSSQQPHWSVAVTDWHADRWDAMSTAPMHGAIVKVRIRTKETVAQFIPGRSIKRVDSFKVHDNVHFAYNLDGTDCPPFIGWYNDALELVAREGEAVDWQPQHAKYNF